MPRVEMFGIDQENRFSREICCTEAYSNGWSHSKIHHKNSRFFVAKFRLILLFDRNRVFESISSILCQATTMENPYRGLGRKFKTLLGYTANKWINKKGHHFWSRFIGYIFPVFFNRIPFFFIIQSKFYEKLQNNLFCNKQTRHENDEKRLTLV